MNRRHKDFQSSALPTELPSQREEIIKLCLSPLARRNWRLSTRMRFVIGAFEAVGGDMGIDLRGDEMGVAKEFLYAAEIGAGIEHVRGVAVAEFVRGEVGIEAGES